MKNMIERAKFVCGGEEGASNVEIIIWISVVLVLALALFAFRENIEDFLAGSGESVNKLDTDTNTGFGIGQKAN